MAKNTSCRLRYDAALTLTFVLFSLALIILARLLQGRFQIVERLFQCAGGRQGEDGAFNFASLKCYLGLLLHEFGNSSVHSFLINSSIILLLGPPLEERYGSGLLAIMAGSTSLVSGVVTACFLPCSITGATGIVFMMICLKFSESPKKAVPLSLLLALIFCLAREILPSGGAEFLNVEDCLGVLAEFAGGLCGSLFALATPSKKRQSSQNKKTTAKKMRGSVETADPDATILDS